MACTRARSTAFRDWRIASNARMTCCWRPMTSSAGSWRSHADTDFAETSGSAISLVPGVRKLNMGYVGFRRISRDARAASVSRARAGKVSSWLGNRHL